MNPTKRDPRLAGAPKPAEPKEQTDQADLLQRAIPAEGTAEHAEYVKGLLDRIRELEEAGVAASGLPRTLGLRVSPKGGVSVYGLNANFPVTLYPEQWIRLFEEDNQKRILDFIEANKDVLEYKSEDDIIKQGKEERRRAAGIVPRQPQRNIPKAA